MTHCFRPGLSLPAFTPSCLIQKAPRGNLAPGSIPAGHPTRALLVLPSSRADALGSPISDGSRIATLHPHRGDPRALKPEVWGTHHHPRAGKQPQGAFLGCWEGGAWLRTSLGAHLSQPVSGRLMHTQRCVPSAGRYWSIPQSRLGSLEARGEQGVRGAGEGEEWHRGLCY